jgi:Bacterial Ig-like domain (group 3)
LGSKLARGASLRPSTVSSKNEEGCESVKRWRVVLCGVLVASVSTVLVSSVALAGASPLTWAAPVLIDHQPPFAGNGINGVSCPTTSFCVAVDTAGNVLTSTNPTGPASAWTVSNLSGKGMGAVSCPTTGLCVATSGGLGGTIYTSTNPTGGAGAWTGSNIDGSNPLGGVSCPSTSLCVVVDGSGNALTSTNPGAALPVWTPANIDPGNSLFSISCPSVSLCVAGDFSGNVVTSTNPTGGGSAWTVTKVDGNNFVGAVSCASATLCVAADSNGNVVTSTNPTGGATAWTAAHVDGPYTLNGISCPSTTLCVAVDNFGDVVQSTNPGGPAAAWNTSHVEVPFQAQLAAVSCPTNSLCVAGDSSGNVVTSTNPSGGASAWTITNVDGNNSATSVSCPSSGLCVVADGAADVLTSTNPTGGAGAWTVTNLSQQGLFLNAISCPTSALCVAAGGGAVDLAISTNPTGGVFAWNLINVDSASNLSAVSCPNTSLCIAVDGAGNVLTSTNPTGGLTAWTAASIDPSNALFSLSCPTISLCVAGDSAGNVLTSSNPTGGAAAWTIAHIDSSTFNNLTALSCTASSLCVAGDGSGNVITSTNPRNGSSAWTSSAISGVYGLVAMSCPTSTLCVGMAGGGNAVTSTDPTGGGSTWTATQIDTSTTLFGISCPSNSLCVAVDNVGNVITGTGPRTPTVTSVQGNPNPGTVGQSVSYVATITPLPDGGTVAFTDNGVTLSGCGAVPVITSIGVASCSTTYGATGSHSIIASYSGDSSFAASSGGPITEQVNAGSTTTTTVSSSNPSTTGGRVTYTATVSPTPDGGTIGFTDNAATLSGCGAVTVNTSTGKASCTTSYSAAGSHSIAANYSGDTNFTASSGSLTQQVITAAAVAVLPAMANGAYGGFTTAATIQNTGTAAAAIRIDYFDQNGAPVGTGDAIGNLPVNGSWTVRQDNGNSFPSSGGAAQAGSAVIYSSQPVAAFVNEFAPGNIGDATSYTGVQVAGGVGTTLFAPTIVNNAYGGYTTGIGLLNEGSSATDVTITYRDGGGNVIKTKTVPGLAAHAYLSLYSGDAALALPNGFAGTATITSSAGQPLGAVVNEVGPGGQFSSYDAVPAGSTTLYAPVALRNAFGGYNTGMGIVNTTAAAGTVTINYYDSSGTPTTTTASIPAHGSLGVYQGTDIPVDGSYTAKISSDVAIAAIVNEVAASSTSAKQSTSYNTFSAGSATLHFPLVESAGADGWSTGDGIMNTGTTTTTVTVSYIDTSSGAPVGSPQSLSLAPNAFWGLYQPTGGLPSGMRATAVITTSSGGQVAAICNESNTTTFMSYDGQ